MSKPAPPSCANLVQLLNWRGTEANVSERSITYLVDGENQETSLTYCNLDQRARTIGAWLQERKAQGKRVLLLYPPGSTTSPPSGAACMPAP